MATIMKNFLSASNIRFYLKDLLVLFQEKKIIKKKILFNFLVSFWTELDENGSMTWNVMCDKISILYYFNDENIDLEKMLFLLKEFAKTYGLNSQGWKHLPAMAVSNSKH